MSALVMDENGIPWLTPHSEGGGGAATSAIKANEMTSLINSNLLLWQKNRSEEAQGSYMLWNCNLRSDQGTDIHTFSTGYGGVSRLLQPARPTPLE